MPVKERVLDEIRRMSVADLVDLVHALEREIAGCDDGAAAEAAESSGTGVSLRDFGADKIGVIRAVREVTELGLREARVAATDEGDPDGGPEGTGLPAKPKAPPPSGEVSERMEVPVRPRRTV